MKQIPNILTLSRLVMAPVIILLMFLGSPHSVAYIGLDNTLAWLALSTYALAGITDYLDGVLARQNGWISRLGKLMDPIADKVLVISVIVALLSLDRLQGWHFIAAWIIVIREICIAGLREFLSTNAQDIPVSSSGKLKTAIQILALGFLIVAPAGDAFLPCTTIGLTLLWLAAALTLSSAYEYIKSALPRLDLS